MPSYDFKPEMSAEEVADRFCAEIGDGYGFAVVNFANPDMVGHTGVIPAVVKAVETTDRCLGRVVEAVERARRRLPRHRRPRQRRERCSSRDGVSPHTAHTTNPVPLHRHRARASCATAASSPTSRRRCCRSSGSRQPPQMTGKDFRETAVRAALTTRNSRSGAILAHLWRSRNRISRVLQKAQRGDERAFAIIVRTYETPVFNYILRLTGDRSLAEDLTQEVFVRVFQGLPQFSLRCKFTTWLFQVTKNRVLDELRARERRPLRARRARRRRRRSRCYDQPIERIETIDAIWRAVEELNRDLKMALLLRDVVGLSYNEIADSLEITLATVKWRIFKAREEVQLALAREGISFGRRAPKRRAEPRRELLIPGAEPQRASACGQPGLADLGLRQRDRVLGAPEPAPARVEVEHEPGGARVAVARLADRARVQQPARRPRGRPRCPPAASAAGERLAVAGDRERDVAVADQDERRGRSPAGSSGRRPR